MESMIITIQNCPLCKKSHKHSLRIEREEVFGFLTVDCLKETVKVIDVVLLCPTKKTQFKATIEISESSLDKIKKVKEEAANADK